ncbi:uncharacterized protein N7483_007433 [Penicillium malachiteum]|uniref:uncharacterized protein n=1 Tax=Penicillium malachiteum TaxID=1324776 RepID=UPI002547D352|nr:uncharacterized protein N7483_007433 [Penicillium malachiteum]KAJ5726076.1 hypothetical protein N7483_007433 [Penicillium malachiteum]
MDMSSLGKASRGHVIDESDESTQLQAIKSDTHTAPPAESQDMRLEIDSSQLHNAHRTQYKIVASSNKNSKSQPILQSLRDWGWEVSGIFASAIMIVTIVVILGKFNGRPQDAWKLKYISLHSVISWLSTLASGLVMFSISQGIGQLKWLWLSKHSRPLSDLAAFDSASRGATGSVILPWVVKGQNMVALLACLATVLAIGFDPFIQNLVHYVPGNIDSPSETSLLSGTSIYNTVGPLMGGDLIFVDPILKANVFNSLFNTDPSQPWAEPQYTCPTGNCTWDPIATLEIRAFCHNVTSNLTTTCRVLSDTTNCTVTLHSGTLLFYLTTGGEAQPMVVETLQTEGLYANPDTFYRNSSFPVIQYILAMGSNDDPLTGGGIATEIGNTTQFVATDFTYDSLQPPWNETLGIKGSQTFGVGREAWDSLWTFFNSIFAGYVMAGSDDLGFMASSSGGTYAIMDSLEAIFYGNFTGKICQDADQLSCAIKNVAAAMSKTIRDSAFTYSAEYQPYADNGLGTNSTSIVGRTLITASFVEVHWEWLTLPIIVWVLGALSCFCTAWMTHKSHMKAWMNQIFPLVFLRSYRDNTVNFEGGGDEAFEEVTGEQDGTYGHVLTDYSLVAGTSLR